MSHTTRGARDRLRRILSRAAAPITTPAATTTDQETSLVPRLRDGPLRVVFLIHLIEAFDGCADVIASMAASADFEPVVVSIPRRFNGELEFGFEEDVHRFLDTEGVAHHRITVAELADGRARLEALEPDLVVRQSQWDDDVPPAFSTAQLRFVRTALIPYETMNIVENVEQPGTTDTALDSPLHREAWIVFCTNDLVLEAARRSGGGSRFAVTGHPKADRLRCAVPASPNGFRRGGSPTARIAWSAHHSIASNWTGFGAFPLMAHDMLTWARDCPDCDFVFLPHPALVAFCNRPESPITRAEFEDWHTRWSALPNTATSTHGRYAGVLAASDLLVTDGLSLLVEYQLFERPVIYFERAGHRPFNRIGQIVRQGAHAVTTTADARRVAARLLDEPDPLVGNQRDNVARLFGNEPATPRMMAALRERVRDERLRGHDGGETT
ncbi:MAG: hypothetical protein ACXVJ7_03560 [Acidimicrobiia bacterium]